MTHKHVAEVAPDQCGAAAGLSSVGGQRIPCEGLGTVGEVGEPRAVHQQQRGGPGGDHADLQFAVLAREQTITSRDKASQGFVSKNLS